MKTRVLFAGVFLVALVTLTSLAAAHGGRRGGGGAACGSQFAVANGFSAPIDVWVLGQDGDSGYLGTAWPGTEQVFTHSYWPDRGGDSHCDRCQHLTQIRYVVPRGYPDVGQVLCVDQFEISPCYVRLTEFGGPGVCGHTRGIR
jgi:hypothetical protein